MIRIGLTSFKEHVDLTGKKQSTLFEYASHLSLVELDTAYYGIPKRETVEKWVHEVPENFRFVVKVYSGISGQGNFQPYYASEEEMITAFLTNMAPLIQSGKLFAFLVQFSGVFACTKANLLYLQKIRHWFTGLPIAIELRNRTWYHPQYQEKTLQFMRENAFSLVIVDEPQVPTNPVPFVPAVTNEAFALFRFHGRNVAGWMANDKDWRKKRTLYRYSAKELTGLAEDIRQISTQVSEVGVIFNNNSGGDAADNALTLKQILGLAYTDLNPTQLDLF